MRRKLIVSAIAAVCLISAIVVWQTSGQNPFKAAAAKEASLPIRQVVLFNSGVGYLEREGEVDGNAHVDLTFPTSDINDLLKSLVLQDLNGGKVTSVNYDSHDPLDKILHSFALDLNNNPTFGQILNQARGEKIEIMRQEKKDEKATRLAGTIVGMEAQKKQFKDGMVEVELLNLVGDNGLTSIPMEQVVSVKFLNPVLESEFQRALRVLAAAHDTQKKTVSLGFTGQGKRHVKVGYVVEHPIWKTSYRLRIEPNGKVFIQGWAIVENTSDDDWNDVRMVLVSGRPITYKMNLYEPLYIPRPTVEPELFASLRPPVYSGGGMETREGRGPMTTFVPPPPGAVPPQFNQFMGQIPAQTFNQSQNPMNPGNRFQFDAQNPFNNNPLQPQKLTFEELQERNRKIDAARKDAKKAGPTIAGLNFKEGIASVASAEEIGDYYQYVLDQKISLPRQKSAMLPIIDHLIDGTKVSIYNETIQQKFPLLGLRLKNSSEKPLNQGPVTVYEDSSYSGDTRILDLQPKEERLLSYALDQAVEIKSDVKATPSPDMHFKMGDASLTAHYNMRETRTYTIKNRATKERTIILEHHNRPDWKLVEPKKPMEVARTVTRFEVHVPAGETVKFNVVEDHARSDQVALLGGQPSYVTNAGIQIKALTYVSPSKLLGLKIQKGFLLPTLKERESKTYFIQNNSDINRDFTVDHIVRAGWSRLTDQGDPQNGPAVFSFILKVPVGKTAQKEVTEERTHQVKGSLVKDLTEETTRGYLANPIPSADVKSALSKVLAMNAKIAETGKSLAEQEKLLKNLSDDQARIRENLKIIPQTSEPYKKILDKFVNQETEIEAFQRQIRQLQVSLGQQQRELDVFVAALTVE